MMKRPGAHPRVRAILELHVLLVVMLVFFTLYGPRGEAGQGVGGMLGLLGAAGLYLAGLFRLPAAWWERTSVLTAVCGADLVLATASLLLTQGFETDLYLVFFLLILVTAVAGSVRGSWFLAGLASSLYVTLWLSGRGWPVEGSVLWMRIPFFFVVTLISSYFVDALRSSEVRRKETARWTRRLHQQIQDSVEAFRSASARADALRSQLREARNERDRLRYRLEATEDRARILGDQVSDLVIHLDAQTQVVNVNRRLRDLLGLAPASWMGKSLAAHIEDPLVRRRVDRLWAEVDGNPQGVTVDISFRAAGGTLMMIRWNFRRVAASDSGWILQGVGHSL